jgi:hypothetical protein
MDGRQQAQGLRPEAQAALSDSQLDRDIESAVGIEPSAEFLARVRTRIAAEPEPSAWRLSFEPMWGVAIAGIVLALIVPQMLRPQPNGSDVVQSNQETGDAPPPVTARAQVSPVVPRVSADVRRAPRRAVVVESANEGLSSRGPRFEDLVLIAPGDQEAFDRLLAVVNDQTIELIAPVLESTRAGVDVIGAAVPVPLRAEEGVNE